MLRRTFLGSLGALAYGLLPRPARASAPTPVDHAPDMRPVMRPRVAEGFVSTGFPDLNEALGGGYKLGGFHVILAKHAEELARFRAAYSRIRLVTAANVRSFTAHVGQAHGQQLIAWRAPTPATFQRSLQDPAFVGEYPVTFRLDDAHWLNAHADANQSAYVALLHLPGYRPGNDRSPLPAHVLLSATSVIAVARDRQVTLHKNRYGTRRSAVLS